MTGATDLAGLLAEGGAVVAGGAALFGTCFFVVASMARDLGVEVDPFSAAEQGARLGGAAGVAALLLRAAAVH